MSVPYSVQTTVTPILTSSDITVFTAIVPTTDTYTVQVMSTMPSIQTGGIASGVVTKVKVAGSTKYTSDAGNLGSITTVSATSGDTILVTQTSSVAQDQLANAVKTTVVLSEGSTY